MISHCEFHLHFSDDQHLFMILLDTCTFYLEKCLFKSSAYILIGLFAFLILSCMNCLYILDINPLLVMSFGNTFFLFSGWLTLFWGAPKSLQMVISAMKLKDAYSLEGKL